MDSPIGALDGTANAAATVRPSPAATGRRLALWGRLAMLAFAACMVGASFVGGVRWFSPVPIGDAWDGIVSFRLLQQAGEQGLWWAQHNEHRIVLARLLFWLDFELFGGRTVFLVVANFALAGAAALLFAALVRWRLRRDGVRSAGAEWFFTALLAAWLLQWMQFENLTRPFQSQFFLATLVPLAALVFLYRATLPAAPRRDFAIACALGIAAIGTMANGVLTLPLMVAYALLTGQGSRRIGVLVLLSALTMAAYFHGYFTIPGHGSLRQALREQPLELLQYWLAYVGGPFQKLAAGTGHGRTLAVAMGALFALLSLAAALRALRLRRSCALELALLVFLLYFCATALATAGGRVNFGIDQAFSSRYTTPALMAWAALLLLYAPALVRVLAPRPPAAVAAALLLMLPMLHAQREALQPRGELMEMNTGALALGLGVHDEAPVLQIYPVYEHARRIAERAVAEGIAVYAHFPFAQLRAQLGQPAGPAPRAVCQGFVDQVESIDGEPRFLRITGWLFDAAGGTVPQQARFVDAQDRIAGFVIAGGTRPDVAKLVDRRAGASGFRGYVLADRIAPPLRLQDSAGGCQLPLQLQRPIFSTAPATLQGTPAADPAQAGVRQLLPGGTWNGSDYQRSAWPGWRVLGSYHRSDADTGAIELKLRRGERLLYRSGPVGGRQRLEIPGSGLPPAPLPVATDWTVLTLSGAELPAGEFVVRLVDDGSAWGEWSAIALKE